MLSLMVSYVKSLFVKNDRSRKSNTYLSKEEREEVRELISHGWKQKDIAKRFNVSDSTISCIKREIV